MIHGTDVYGEAAQVVGFMKHPVYRWGGKTPDAGLDCSGLVTWVMRELGVYDFPHGSYNIYDYCESGALEVDIAKRITGALLYRRSRSGKIAHVAIIAPHRATVEARGRKYGVGHFKERGGWTDATIIPGVLYG